MTRRLGRVLGQLAPALALCVMSVVGLLAMTLTPRDVPGPSGSVVQGSIIGGGERTIGLFYPPGTHLSEIFQDLEKTNGRLVSIGRWQNIVIAAYPFNEGTSSEPAGTNPVRMTEGSVERGLYQDTGEATSEWFRFDPRWAVACGIVPTTATRQQVAIGRVQ